VIKPVGLGPTEYGDVWNPILFYQSVVPKENTPYASTWVADPSDTVTAQLLLQDVAPALGLVAGTETVSKESYCFHTVIISYKYYALFFY
jgi:hypothetical protein